MKRILCLLLALMLVLSMAACSGEKQNPDKEDRDEEETTTESTTKETESEPTTEPEPSLQEQLEGSWLLYLSINADNSGLEGFESDAALPVLFTFYADGTFVQETYSPEIESAIARLKQDLADYMVENIYSTLESEGYSRAVIDKEFQSAYGMTIVEYAQSQVEKLDAEAFIEKRKEGSYTLTGDQLYMDSRNETLTIAIDGDTMTILDSDDADKWKPVIGDFPVELKRIEE